MNDTQTSVNVWDMPRPKHQRGDLVRLKCDASTDRVVLHAMATFTEDLKFADWCYKTLRVVDGSEVSCIDPEDLLLKT